MHERYCVDGLRAAGMAKLECPAWHGTCRPTTGRKTPRHRVPPPLGRDTPGRLPPGGERSVHRTSGGDSTGLSSKVCPFDGAGVVWCPMWQRAR